MADTPELHLAKRVLDRIQAVQTMLQDRDGRPIRWFYSFGTMLEYCADRTFSIDKFDIDIGMFQGDCEAKWILRAWEESGYKAKVVRKSDATGEPLNIHCDPTDERLANTPTVDIYLFVKHGNEFLYTYDMERSGKQIPDKYRFKGIARECLEPGKEAVEAIRGRSHPESRLLLDDNGIWHYDVFVDHGPYKVHLPFAYGTLCDQWYPGWRFREMYRGQSVSKKLLEVHSCEGIV
jgi:hypothetical protein